MASSFPPVQPEPEPTTTRTVIRQGWYWGGAVATAIVASLVGVVGVLVFSDIVGIPILPPADVLGTGSDQIRYVPVAVGGTVIAAIGLYVLLVATPRPTDFFAWIMGLVTVVVALLPFTVNDATLASQLATGATNLLVSLAIWTLLASVASMSVRYVTVPAEGPPA